MTQKAWTHMMRDVANWAITWYKLTHPCVDCGEQDPDLLTFDHRRGKNGPIKFAGFEANLPKVLAEIQLCEVRCHNCHMKRTRNQERELGYTSPPPILIPSHRLCGHRWGHCHHPNYPLVQDLYGTSRQHRSHRGKTMSC